MEKSLWLVRKESNPNHSQWYIDRFKAMEAEGNDMAGESRLLNAMASRGAKILDAGSGLVVWVSSCTRWSPCDGCGY